MKERVLAILEDMLKKAIEVEAEVGIPPTAKEALEWAIAEIEALPE